MQKSLPDRPNWFVRAGETVFSCSPESEAAISLARVYITRNGFPIEDVAIRRGENSINVVAKKDLELRV